MNQEKIFDVALWAILLTIFGCVIFTATMTARDIEENGIAIYHTWLILPTIACAIIIMTLRADRTNKR